jgi:septal ring factor EnvC (AmiA/AmiB activator)
VALVAGLLLIPLKLSDLFAARQWVFELSNLAGILQQFDAESWISIGVIVVEGLVAGSVFMLAVSYSFNFQQNIGRIGDDILEVKNSITHPQPAPVVNLPNDVVRVDPQTRQWLETLTAQARAKADEERAAMRDQIATLESDLETAKREAEAEREAKATLSQQLQMLSGDLSNISGENEQQHRIIAALKPIVDAIKQLGEQARQVDGSPAANGPAASPPPTLQ